ncbi:MAG: FprA family A-type flavoprotein [Deltaproteobacteria bacterium]|jgi:flavorubredoxin|nr:MAG: FprA family A-type flavoprotein [Deltaproteobacteria bacterium]
MAKVLVVYATRTSSTRDIADLVAEGIRFSGNEAVIVDVKDIKSKADFEGYDGYVFGSPTYHGEMLQSMKTMLFLAEKANLKGKVGGAFGAHGWSTEAQDRIYNTMKEVFKMDMAKGPLLLKSASLGGGVQMAQEYGREIGDKLGS